VALSVGSASVAIIPDFSGAQLAITAFFAKQQNEIRVPVTPDVDDKRVRTAGERIGTRLNEAIADGVRKSSATSKTTASIERDIEKLSVTIDRARAQQEERAKAVTVAETRLNEARSKGTASQSTLLNLELQLERARARQTELTRAQTQAEEALRAAQRSLADAQVKAVADVEAARLRELEKAHAAALKEDERYELARTNLAEAMARGREDAVVRAHTEALKINARLDREAQRETERLAKDAARTAAELERERVRLHEQAIRENERQDREALRRAKLTAKELFDEIDSAQREAIKLNIEFDKSAADRAARSFVNDFSPALKREFDQRKVFIASIAAASLATGGPVLAVAASGLFAGIGLAAASSSEQVRSSWLGTWESIREGAQYDARVLVPVYTGIARDVGESFQRMRPLLREAFTEVGPQVQGFSSSLIQAAENALPGLVRAVSTAGPTVTGFGDLLEKTGTGVSKLFDTLSQNQGTFGGVFSQLGDSVNELLPALGSLAVAGAQTANSVLPAVNTAFGSLNSILGVVGPALPAIATGFLAFRSADKASEAVGTLGARMEASAAKGGAFSRSIGASGAALSGLSSSFAGAAGPIAGIAALVGASAANFEYMRSSADQAAAGLLRGGAAAVQAAESIRPSIAGMNAGWVDAVDNVANYVEEIPIVGQVTAWAWDAVTTTTEEAADATNSAYEEMLEGLSTLEAAQMRAQTAQEDYNLAVRNHGEGSREARAALGELEGAQREAAIAAENHERALYGVTQAMLDQAAAAAGRVNAAFDYQGALLDVQKTLDDAEAAQADYNAAVAEFGPGSEEARDALLELQLAQLDFNEALNTQVVAKYNETFAQLPASMLEGQKEILASKAALDELNGLMALGFELPPSMEAYRQELIRITEEAGGAALEQAQLSAAFQDLGIAVDSIPGQRSIRIDTEGLDVPGLTQQMQDLGFSVREVDGELIITANTQEARDNIGNLTSLLTPYINGQNNPPPIPVEVDSEQAQEELEYTETELQEFADRPPPTVSLRVDGDNAIAQTGAVEEALAGLPPESTVRVTGLTEEAAQKLDLLGFDIEELPDGSFEVTARSEEAKEKLADVREDALALGREIITPVVNLYDRPFANVAAGVSRTMQDIAAQTPTPTANLNDRPFASIANSVQSVIGNIARQTPTPTANLNDRPFASIASNVQSVIGNIARQTPTPTASMNDRPFASIASNVQGVIGNLSRQSANPTASLIDNASGVARNITSAINGIPNRTVWVSVVTSGVSAAQNILAAAGLRDGGAIQRYDGGGAVRGPGGPRDDRIWAQGPSGRWDTKLSNGEHVLDAQDVNLMGGQAAVYAFRHMLNAGQLDFFAEGGAATNVDDSVRRMVSNGSLGVSATGGTSVTGVNVGRDLVLQDNADTLFRKADASKRRAMVEAGLV
jgi:hypothetical protein